MYAALVIMVRKEGQNFQGQIFAAAPPMGYSGFLSLFMVLSQWILQRGFFVEQQRDW